MLPHILELIKSFKLIIQGADGDMEHLELFYILLVAMQNWVTNLKHRFEKETPTT